MVAVRYAAPTELENLMIPISTNMPRLTALGIRSGARVVPTRSGWKDGRRPEMISRLVGLAKLLRIGTIRAPGQAFGVMPETATGTGALPSNVPAGRPMAVWGGRTGPRAVEFCRGNGIRKHRAGV